MPVKKATRPAAKTVRPSALQAESLRQTRREHASETAEDYVEAIADLSASLGEARVVDLARRLGSARDGYEFQMLYGIRDDEQRRLAAEEIGRAHV